jgi:large subunit ribosomal protein L28
LDRYLLGSKTARLKELGPMGWSLRWKIMNTPWYKKQMEAEMEALGLTGTGKPVTDSAAHEVSPPVATGERQVSDNA